MLQKFSESTEAQLSARHWACARFSGDIRGKLVLDVGCWIGWYEQMNTMYNVIGLDLNLNSLKKAQQNNPSVSFVYASASHLPFREGCFDQINIFDTIEHMPEDSFLSEAWRILNGSGVLIISTYSNALRSRLLDPAYFLTNHKHYSPEKMSLILSSSNFSVEKIEMRGGIVEACSMLLFYVFKHVFNAEIPGKSWLEEKRVKEYDKPGFEHLFVKARVNR